MHFAGDVCHDHHLKNAYVCISYISFTIFMLTAKHHYEYLRYQNSHCLKCHDRKINNNNSNNATIIMAIFTIITNEAILRQASFCSSDVMRHRKSWSELLRVMVCRLFGAKPLPEPLLTYSISQEICTRFCCALLCCGYAIVHNEFTWSIYPYSSGLLCWHWGNR